MSAPVGHALPLVFPMPGPLPGGQCCHRCPGNRCDKDEEVDYIIIFPRTELYIPRFAFWHVKSEAEKNNSPTVITAFYGPIDLHSDSGMCFIAVAYFLSAVHTATC